MDLHGGNIYKLERIGKKNILDYSSNINPFGIPQKFIDKVKENFEALTRYPDPDYIELREKIAIHSYLKLDNVIVGNGATEILFLYMRAMKPKKVLLLAPCFAEYKRALDSVHAEIEYFELEEEKDFAVDIENLINRIKSGMYDLVLLCNPNNPTGKFIDLKELYKLKKCIEEKNINLFIDEAFIEFVDNWRERTAVLLKSKNIFIMRAFTKFFAIPGLRLGYGLSYNEEILEKMWVEKEPWSVNGFANLAGLSMLDDKEYIEKTEKWIAKEKKFMYEELSTFQNIKVYKTECNFILIKLFNMSSQNLREQMIEKNILVRDASNFKFLDYRFVRLAIKDRESNLKLLEKLSEIVEWRG